MRQVQSISISLISILIPKDSMLKHPSLIRNEPQSNKFRLFRLFHNIIENYSAPRNVFLVLLVIESLQMLTYCIHPTYKGLWDTPFIQVLQSILAYVDLSGLWHSGKSIAILVWSILILLIVGLALAIIGWEIQREPNPQAHNSQDIKIKYLQYVGLGCRTILVIPMVSACTHSISQIISRDGSLGLLITAFIVSLLASLVLLGFLILVLFFYIDDSPFSSLPFSVSISHNELKKNILKVCMGIYGGIMTGSAKLHDYNIIFGVLTLSGFLYLLYAHYMSPNILDKPTRHLSEHSIVLLAWINFMALLQVWLSKTMTLSLIFVASGCVMINWCWQRLKEHRQNSLIFQSFTNLMSKEDILSYIYLMCEYIRDLHQSPLNLIKIEGMLSEHLFQCKKNPENCFCFNLKEKLMQYSYGDRAELKLETKDWYEYVKYNLTVASEKYQDPEYYLLLANVEKQVLRNNFRTYKNLEHLKSRKEPVKHQFLCYHQKRIVEAQMAKQDMKNNEKKSVDINSYFDYSLQVRELQENILKSSLQHLDFWKNIQKCTPKDKNKIIQDGNRLEIIASRVKVIFEDIINKHPNSLLTLVLYTNYCKYILNDCSPLGSFKDTVNQVRRKIMKEVQIGGEVEKNKYSENACTGVIIISGQRDSIGTIKYCTSKVTDILKYPMHEMVGQNINMVMPKFIGNMHNEVLYNYLEMAESQFDFVERLAPMIDHNSFMILCRILTKPFPSLLNGLEMVGIFEKISEMHIKHPNEIPKYILYRGDSGKIESVSESFHQQYGYKVVKIDQYSEVSSELYFNTLFTGLTDSDLKSDETGCVGSIKSLHKTSTTQVMVYLRHQVIYFGVKLKLLWLFHKEEPNFNMMAFDDDIKNMDSGEFNLRNTSTLSGLKKTGREIAKNSSYNVKKDNQRNLRSISEKVSKDKKPLKLKILYGIFLIVQVVVVIMCSLLLFFNLERIGALHDSLSHLQISSNSVAYLNFVGFYSRLLEMSAKFPELTPSFDHFQNNVSVASLHLQDNQFQLVNQDFGGESGLVKAWKITESGQVYSSSDSLNQSIFDLVTSASGYNSATPSDLNFQSILTDPTNDPNNPIFRNTFHIRYSLIFSLASSKESEHTKLVQSYKSRISSFTTKILLHIIMTTIIVLAFFVVTLLVIWHILDLILQITSLFTYLTPLEIQKELEQCQNFMITCFSEEYEIKLLQIKDSRDETNGEKSDCHDQLWKLNTFKRTFDVNAMKENNDEEEENIDIIMNVNMREKDKTNSERMEEKEDEEKQPLKGEDNSLSELQKSQGEPSMMEESKKKSLLAMIVFYLAIYSYFLFSTIESLSSASHIQIDIEMKSLINSNLRKLAEVQYYSLEAAVDNSQFQAYPLPRNQFDEKVNQLYEDQRFMYGNLSRAMEQVEDFIQVIIDENGGSLCDNHFAHLINYGSGQLSQLECEDVDGGVLKLGLRTSTVAFIETSKKLAYMPNAGQASSSGQVDKFIRIGKYVFSSFEKILGFFNKDLKQHADVNRSLNIGLFVMFVICGNIGMLLVNLKMGKWLMRKNLGINRIISLIPNRVYERNAKLAEKYQEKLEILYGKE